jgi:uncharacterized protein (DUF362 family)/Pyruvate/2-oxoacid:ferredoxin oxidoreductase delta subunit
MSGSVSIIRCDSYNLTSVEAAIREALSYYGGINAFIKPNDKVCLKPNLLSNSKPESAIITHPVIVEIVTKIVCEAGGVPIIVDSPGAGIPHTTKALEKVYQTAGYDRIAEKYQNILNFDTTWSFIPNPSAKLIKRLEVINPVLDCNKIINLPKFKTHTFTVFSGAVKNMFGIVPGFVKPGYHARLQDVSYFSELLLDLISLIKPTLNIMDAVQGIEGDGPGALGKIRQIGYILASNDAIALDTVMTKIAGADIDSIPLLTAARQRGIIQNSDHEIKLHQGKIEEFIISDFELPKTYDPKGFGFKPYFQKLITPLVKNIFSLKPVIKKFKCQGCKNCVDACPTKVIKIVNQKAKINYSDCIRCYCCIEACPEAAIEPELPFYTRILYHTGVIGLFQKTRLEKPKTLFK